MNSEPRYFLDKRCEEFFELVLRKSRRSPCRDIIRNKYCYMQLINYPVTYFADHTSIGPCFLEARRLAYLS